MILFKENHYAKRNGVEVIGQTGFEISEMAMLSLLYLSSLFIMSIQFSLCLAFQTIVRLNDKVSSLLFLHLFSWNTKINRIFSVINKLCICNHLLFTLDKISSTIQIAIIVQLLINMTIERNHKYISAEC